MKHEKNWLPILEPIVKKAGEIVLSYFGKPLKYIKKAQGFATEADLASEQFLITSLKKVFPQAGIFAEESGINNPSEYMWVIDPLDGTTNFARGISYFCVSIALSHNEVPVVGIIYNPISEELFFAQYNNEAVLNSKKIKVSTPRKFSQALIGLGLGYNPRKRSKRVDAAQYIIRQAAGVRHMGAAALDLANVACGRLDGVLFGGLGWWDVAAGKIIIERAGGMITDFQGNSIKPDFKTCMAGGDMVYKELLKQLTN